MASLQDVAKEVKAAAEIISTVSELLEDAARSVVIEVNNATSQTWRRKLPGADQGHSHGAFKTLPSDSIAPFKSDVFSSRSGQSAIMTGTQGSVFYNIDNEGTELHIRWVVPFGGGNEAHMNL